MSVSTGKPGLDIALAVRADVGEVTVPGHGQQPAGQPAVVHVAPEVAVEAVEAAGVEADVGRIDLGLQGPHGAPVKQVAPAGSRSGGAPGERDVRRR